MHEGQDSIVLGQIEQGLEMSPHYRWKVVSQLRIYLKDGRCVKAWDWGWSDTKVTATYFMQLVV